VWSPPFELINVAERGPAAPGDEDEPWSLPAAYAEPAAINAAARMTSGASCLFLDWVMSGLSRLQLRAGCGFAVNRPRRRVTAS
jgi:hypothetical protein